MGVWKPDVEGVDTRLGAEAGKAEKEDPELDVRGQPGEGRERERVGIAIAEAEGGDDQETTDMAEDQVDISRSPGLLLVELVEHQEERGQ